MIAVAGVISLLPFSNIYVTKIEQYFFTNYIPHSGALIYQQVKIFLQHADELSWVGFSSLGVTTYLMLFSIESQLNAIWREKRDRTIMQSLFTHSIFLICATVLIGLMSFLRIYSHVFLHSPKINFIVDQSIPFLVSITLFSLLYKIMPSHVIRNTHALVAGFTATILFEIIKKLFVFYSLHLFVNYHIIYGSLAFVPLFLIWIYISCINFLFCATIIYAMETKYNPKLQRTLYRIINTIQHKISYNK